MTGLRTLLVLSLIFLLPCDLLGQTNYDAEYVENWLGQITGQEPHIELRQIYKNYSRADVIAASERLKLIASETPIDEWQGVYQMDVDLHLIGFHWSANLGFVRYSLYTCSVELRSLGYGKAKDYPEYVLITPEYSENSPQKKSNPYKLIKIKWGERRYLVHEDSIKEFAENAAGVWVYKENSFPITFWIKKDDAEKDVNGLPTLPESYKHLLRPPIETSIISVGKRRVEQEKFDDGSIMNENSVISVVINVGKEMNVKEGMKFYVPELDEWLEVAKAKQKTSLAVLKRMLREGKEDCYDNENKPISCPKPLVGMSAITKYEERIY